MVCTDFFNFVIKVIKVIEAIKYLGALLRPLHFLFGMKEEANRLDDGM